MTTLPLHPIGRASAALVTLALAGCATTSQPVTIPKTDQEPPAVLLALSGPGICTQRMSNPPAEEWAGEDGGARFDLAADTEYKFRVTVSDPGGVASAWLYLPEVFTVDNLSPDTVKAAPAGESDSYVLRGSKKEPLSALEMTGTFRTPQLEALDFITFTAAATGYDFGGAKGPRNGQPLYVEGSVNIDGATEASKPRKKPWYPPKSPAKKSPARSK